MIVPYYPTPYDFRIRTLREVAKAAMPDTDWPLKQQLPPDEICVSAKGLHKIKVTYLPLTADNVLVESTPSTLTVALIKVQKHVDGSWFVRASTAAANNSSAQDLLGYNLFDVGMLGEDGKWTIRVTAQALHADVAKVHILWNPTDYP